MVGSGLASRPTPGSQTADREDSDARDADGATGLPLVRSEAAVLTFSPPSSACLALPGHPPRMLADGATEAADGTADAAEPDGNRAADDSGPLCGGLRGWTRQAPGPTMEGHIVQGAPSSANSTTQSSTERCPPLPATFPTPPPVGSIPIRRGG